MSTSQSTSASTSQEDTVFKLRDAIHAVTITANKAEAANKAEETYQAQRQADIKLIAFHFGLPPKDIEKVLESKEI